MAKDVTRLLSIHQCRCCSSIILSIHHGHHTGEDWVWNVRLWLIRLMCAQRALPQVRHRWSGETEVREVALDVVEKCYSSGPQGCFHCPPQSCNNHRGISPVAISLSESSLDCLIQHQKMTTYQSVNVASERAVEQLTWSLLHVNLRRNAKRSVLTLTKRQWFKNAWHSYF